MLQAANHTQTPASSFFARVNSIHRSTSYESSPEDSPLAISSSTFQADDAADGDIRRSRSLRVAGHYGGRIADSRRDVAGLPSFSTAGSNLSSPASSAFGISQPNPPPAASRHALFSHHARPTVSTSPMFSPSILSDPGVSSPPSPTLSTSSGAFSPASAFLSHFSSSTSLRPSIAPTLAPDAQGARVLDYTLGKVVGRGGFSTVRQAHHVVTNEVFACKIVKRDDLSDRSGSLEKFEEEIETWKNLPRHASLLPLLEMHRTANKGITFFIMPYSPGGSLLDVLKREGNGEKTATRWFSGVVRAVGVLHEGWGCEDLGFEGGLLHGDLKLDNFLVDNKGNVMVCDFYMTSKVTGPRREVESIPTIPAPLSRHNTSTLPAHLHRGPRHSSPFPHTNHHTVSLPPAPSLDTLPVSPNQPFPSASLPYAPPELLRAPPSRPSLAQDIWALGIILYALLTGKLPFVDAFDPRLQMKILKGTWEVPANLGKEWVECLQGCLQGDVSERWDVGMVRDCDALVGWREVKARSKSRSRSRAQSTGRKRGESFTRGYQLDSGRRGRDAQTQAIPINIQRNQSREPRGRALASSNVDLFAPIHNEGLGLGIRPPRSRSASATRTAEGSGSRSRSSGNSRLFELDSHDGYDGMPGMRGRGRSSVRAGVEGLTISTERSSSRGLKTAPVNWGSNLTPNRSRSRGEGMTGMTSISRDQSRPREMSEDSKPRPTISPTVSRSRSSRSTSRGPSGLESRGDEGWAGELAAVAEEGRRGWGEDGSRPRGRQGR